MESSWLRTYWTWFVSIWFCSSNITFWRSSIIFTRWFWFIDSISPLTCCSGGTIFCILVDGYCSTTSSFSSFYLFWVCSLWPGTYCKPSLCKMSFENLLPLFGTDDYPESSGDRLPFDFACLWSKLSACSFWMFACFVDPTSACELELLKTRLPFESCEFEESRTTCEFEEGLPLLNESGHFCYIALVTLLMLLIMNELQLTGIIYWLICSLFILWFVSNGWLDVFWLFSSCSSWGLSDNYCKVFNIFFCSFSINMPISFI